MRTKIYVAYGFRTGHHFVKVDVEKKIKVQCQLLSIEWFNIYACYALRKLWLYKALYLEHL